MAEPENEVASYYQRRLEALARVLQLAPGPGRRDLSTAQCEAIGKSLDEERWSAFLDAAGCCAAAEQIARNLPGPALVLYGSAINVFLRGERDKAGDAAIKAAKKAIKAAKLDKNDDLKKVLEMAHQRAAFAQTSKFIIDQIRSGLVATGKTAVEAEDLAKQVVAAGNKVRHDAQVDSFYQPMLVASGSKILSVSAEDQKRMARGEKVKLADGPIASLFAMSFLVDQFEPLVEPARLGAAYAIASRFTPNASVASS